MHIGRHPGKGFQPTLKELEIPFQLLRNVLKLIKILCLSNIWFHATLAGLFLKEQGKQRFTWSSVEDFFNSNIFQDKLFFVIMLLLWFSMQSRKSLKVCNMKKQLIISSWFFIWFTPLFVCLLQDKLWIKFNCPPSKITQIWWRSYIFSNISVKESNSVKIVFKCQKYLFYNIMDMGMVSPFIPLLITSVHICEACCDTFHLVSPLFFQHCFPGMPIFSLSVTAENFPLIQTPCHATSCHVFDSLLSSVSSLKASSCFQSVSYTLNLCWLTAWLLWALHLLLPHIGSWILTDGCFQGKLGQKLKNNSGASYEGLPWACAHSGCQPSPTSKLHCEVTDLKSEHTRASLLLAEPVPPRTTWGC